MGHFIWLWGCLICHCIHYLHSLQDQFKCLRLLILSHISSAVLLITTIFLVPGLLKIAWLLPVAMANSLGTGGSSLIHPSLSFPLPTCWVFPHFCSCYKRSAHRAQWTAEWLLMSRRFEWSENLHLHGSASASVSLKKWKTRRKEGVCARKRLSHSHL